MRANLLPARLAPFEADFKPPALVQEAHIHTQCGQKMRELKSFIHICFKENWASWLCFLPLAVLLTQAIKPVPTFHDLLLSHTKSCERASKSGTMVEQVSISQFPVLNKNAFCTWLFASFLRVFFPSWPSSLQPSRPGGNFGHFWHFRLIAWWSRDILA